LSATGEETADLPLARIEADAALPLTQGLNPAWAVRMRAFAERRWPLAWHGVDGSYVVAMGAG
jgi:hypothetical protein